MAKMVTPLPPVKLVKKQHTTDQGHGLGDDPQQVGTDGQVAVDEELEDERIQHGDRRRLHDGGVTEPDAADDDKRNRRLPLCFPQSCQGPSCFEGHALDLGAFVVGHREAGYQHDLEHAGDEAGEKQPADVDAGHEAVHNDRQRRNKQQSQGAG